MNTTVNPFKSTLRRLGIYERLQDSAVRRTFRSIFKPGLVRDFDALVDRYRSLGIKRGDLVFDIGANYGEMADVFLALGARVIAVEPQADCVASMRRKYHDWRFSRKAVEIVPAAVSDKIGTAEMFAEYDGSALNTLSSEWAGHHQAGVRRMVETVTLDSLISRHGLPAFIKIDVEGYELPVLLGLTCPVAMLQFEVNLPEFLDSGIGCMKRLHQMSDRARFQFDGLEWLGIGPAENALRNCHKPSVDVLCKM